MRSFIFDFQMFPATHPKADFRVEKRDFQSSQKGIVNWHLYPSLDGSTARVWWTVNYVETLIVCMLTKKTSCVFLRMNNDTIRKVNLI